jgi:hypothetical protein
VLPSPSKKTLTWLSSEPALVLGIINGQVKV